VHKFFVRELARSILFAAAGVRIRKAQYPDTTLICVIGIDQIGDPIDAAPPASFANDPCRQAAFEQIR